MAHLSSQTEFAIAEYTPRATNYEASNAGWHAELADDFVSWVKPTKGDTVLDLACGTGLVAFRMADRVGRDGVVIGVDITPAMLDVARERLAAVSTVGEARIEFVEANIADEKLMHVEVVREVLEREGGFDVVSCCSALVLLDDPKAAIRLWAGLLKKGGRLIVDVPTERWTVQYLGTEILGREVGVEFPFSRAWIKGKESLEDAMKDAGLEVETSIVSRSYLSEMVYEGGQVDEVFETMVLGKYGRFHVEKGMVEEARAAWMRLWPRALAQDGKFYDGHWLYICVGRKGRQDRRCHRMHCDDRESR